MRRRIGAGIAALALVGTLGAVVGTGAVATAATAAPATTTSTLATLPLYGLTIAIDPGHQLGNSNPAFFGYLAQRYYIGGTAGYKSCNTSGTATNSGYPEATYNFRVASDLRILLTRLGANVVMTRYYNSWSLWGPCIWIRGGFGTAQHAVLKVSIHADGASSSGHGFFVIKPAAISSACYRYPHGPYMVTRSSRLGNYLIYGMKKAGFTPSTYVNNATIVEGNQGTLNCSYMPTVIVETLNMRNAGDAAIAVSSTGQARVALGLLYGIRGYLGR